LTPAKRSAAGRQCRGGECRHEGERNGAAPLHVSSGVSGYYPKAHRAPPRTRGRRNTARAQCQWTKVALPLCGQFHAWALFCSMNGYLAR
jgi:hypothetical protein